MTIFFAGCVWPRDRILRCGARQPSGLASIWDWQRWRPRKHRLTARASSEVCLPSQVFSATERMLTIGGQDARRRAFTCALRVRDFDCDLYRGRELILDVLIQRQSRSPQSSNLPLPQTHRFRPRSPGPTPWTLCSRFRLELGDGASDYRQKPVNNLAYQQGLPARYENHVARPARSEDMHCRDARCLRDLYRLQVLHSV
jgi:hypothetical protein